MKKTKTKKKKVNHSNMLKKEDSSERSPIADRGHRFVSQFSHLVELVCENSHPERCPLNGRGGV